MLFRYMLRLAVSIFSQEKETGGWKKNVCKVIYNFYISPNASAQVKEDDMGLTDTYMRDKK